jgi:hypothetical protein
MRAFRLLGLASLYCFVSVATFAQQSASTPAVPTQSDPQAVALIQRSVAVLTGGGPVTDVTMTGTFTTIIGPREQTGGITTSTGSITDSGTIRFVAIVAGQGKSVVTNSSGTRTEVRDISSGSPVLMETGTDGVSVTVTTQSAVSPHPDWFYPLFLMSSSLSSASYASSYVGEEILNGTKVQHATIRLGSDSSSGTPQFSEQATQHDVYLDSSSLLPVAITFTVRPYDPTNPNRPFVPIRGNPIDTLEQATFSDYRPIQGRPVAFHIHTSVKAGTLDLITDMQFSSIDFNSGATISAN